MSGLIDNPQLTFDDMLSVETHKEEFGKDKSLPKTPKVIGKSKAEEWVKSLKEKQRAESHVKGQVSLTGGASTAHRLTEFEIDPESLAYAESLGAKACKKGMKNIPLFDKEFQEIIKNKKEVGESIPFHEAWQKGWTKANLHEITEAKTETPAPWQMTRQEAISEAAKPLGSMSIQWGEMRTSLASGRRSAESLHKDMVKLAITEGKPVPGAVLREYPDLQAKPVHAESKSEIDVLIENLMERVQASKTVKEAADLNQELNRQSFKHDIPIEKMNKVYALIEATIERLEKEKELKEALDKAMGETKTETKKEEPKQDIEVTLLNQIKAAKTREELNAVGREVTAFLESLPSVTGLRSETDVGMIVSKAFNDRVTELLRVQPRTPEETASMHPWGYKELDAVKLYRDQEIKKYQKNIEYVKRELKDLDELKAKLDKDPENRNLRWNWRQMRKTAETNLGRMPYWEKAIENYNSPDWIEKHKESYRERYIKEVKQAISKGKPVPAEVIAQYSEFRKARDARERYEKGWKTSFANVSAAVVESTKETTGVKVKRQDGKPITKQQIEEIVSGLKDIQDVVGNIIPVMKNENITVAHTSGKFPFLSQAGGMYHPSEKSVTMGIAGTKAAAHEIAHFLDDVAKTQIPQTEPKYDLKLIGEASARINDYYGVDRMLSLSKYKTKEEKEAARLLRAHLGSYWRRQEEIFARLVEQYIAFKNQKSSTAYNSVKFYEKTPGWWTHEDFLQLLPMVEAELKRKLDLAFKKHGMTPTPAQVHVAAAPVKINPDINWKLPKLAKEEEIVWMSPREFLSKVPHPAMPAHLRTPAVMGLDEKYYDSYSLKSIGERIEKGYELNAPFIDYTHDAFGWATHDGRHRALIALKMGIDKIPVLIIGKPLIKNPGEIIGDKPNPIMKQQLLKLWKQLLGAEDLGDFETFMKEVSDLTYHEAKEKLLKTYGSPKGKEAEKSEKGEAMACDYAMEQCNEGINEACTTACQDCHIKEACEKAPIDMTGLVEDKIGERTSRLRIESGALKGKTAFRCPECFRGLTKTDKGLVCGEHGLIPLTGTIPVGRHTLGHALDLRQIGKDKEVTKQAKETYAWFLEEAKEAGFKTVKEYYDSLKDKERDSFKEYARLGVGLEEMFSKPGKPEMPARSDYQVLNDWLDKSEKEIDTPEGINLEGVEKYKSDWQNTFKEIYDRLPKEQQDDIFSRLTGMTQYIYDKKKEAEAKRMTETGFIPNAALINKQLADRSHSGTSWDAEKRAEQEIEGFVQYVQEMYEKLKPYAKSDAQKASLIEEMETFQRGFAQKYNEKLSAQGRTISSFITGGSKFPTRRAEKANASYDKRFQEMLDWKDRAEKAIIRKLKGEAIEEAGGEVPLLEKKLKDLEKLQEMMVEANKIIRKKAEPGIEGVSKHKQLVNLGFSEQKASELLKPDFMGRTGFSYHLQNNNQEIHRLRDRIAQLQRKEVTETREFEFTGGTILDNQKDDRVQIFFDQKPAQEIINKLKGEGWHWSPSVGAWQRKRTEYALMSANRITGVQAETQFGQKEKEAPEEKKIDVQWIFDKYTDGFNDNSIRAVTLVSDKALATGIRQVAPELSEGEALRIAPQVKELAHKKAPPLPKPESKTHIETMEEYRSRKAKVWNEIKDEPIRDIKIEIQQNRDRGKGREYPHVYIITTAVTDKGEVRLDETIYKGTDVRSIMKSGVEGFRQGSQVEYVGKRLSDKIDLRYFTEYSDLVPKSGDVIVPPKEKDREPSGKITLRRYYYDPKTLYSYDALEVINTKGFSYWLDFEHGLSPDRIGIALSESRQDQEDIVYDPTTKKAKVLPAKVEPAHTDPKEARNKLRADIAKQGDTLDHSIIDEIMGFKPMGKMSEMAEVMRAQPKKGEAVGTPFGTFVFAKDRMPDKEQVEKWHQMHKKADELQKSALDYSYGIDQPRTNTTTGNYRVVEQGQRLRSQGLLSPAELKELEKLEKFWQDHPELDKYKDVGVYTDTLEIKPWVSSLKAVTRPPITEAKDVIKPGMDEHYYFGSKVTVKPGDDPELEPTYQGTIIRVLNDGKLIEVRPDGQKEGSFRIPVERVQVDALVTKPKEPEYKRPEYKLKQWTILYAPHLDWKWTWSYMVEGFSSWWQKEFKSFDEIKELLKKGESELYVHGVRGNEKVKWTPKTLTEPKLKQEAGKNRIKGDTIYSLIQPYFNSLDDKWVWRARKAEIKTGDFRLEDVDEAELLNAKEFTEAQMIEARIERELAKYRMDNYSKAEMGTLYFIPDLVRNLIEDAKRLPKEKSDKYLGILEDMRTRAIAERNKREEAEKQAKEKEKPPEPEKPKDEDQVKVAHAKKLISEAFAKDTETKDIASLQKLFVKLKDEETKALSEGVDTKGKPFTDQGHIIQNLKDAINHVLEIKKKKEQAEKEKPAEPARTEPKAEPAKVTVPELMFKSYIQSTMLTTGALASPKFLSDEKMAQDIYKNIQVSLEEARKLVPQFRAIAEKKINKEEIESVKESFGIDLEQEAHNRGIDLADYAIIKAGNRVILQHKTIVQKKYEIKEPKEHREETDRKLNELTAKKEAEKILRIDLDKYDAYEWGTRVKLIEKQAAKGEMKAVLATGHLLDEEYEKVKPFIKGVQQPRKPLKPTAHFVAKPDKFFISLFDIDKDTHSFEEVEGKQITIKGFDGHDLFLHRTHGAAGYSITEGRSGTSIVRGIKTEKEAMREAEKVLSGFKRTLDKKIAEAVRAAGLSPRYTAVELKRRVEKPVEKPSEEPEPKVEKAVEKSVETVKPEPKPEHKPEPKPEIRLEPVHTEPRKTAKGKKSVKKFAEKFIKTEYGRAIVKKAKAGIIKLTSDDLKADVIILRG